MALKGGGMRKRGLRGFSTTQVPFFDVTIQDYRAVDAIPDSAVSQYRIAEGSGTTLNNEFDGQPDATISGASWTSDGDLEGGWGLDFDGTDDEVDIDSPYDFALGGEQFSFCATVNFSAIEDDTTIWAQDNGNANVVNCGWSRDSDPDGIGIGFYDGSVRIAEVADNTPLGRTRVGFRIDLNNFTADIFFDGSEDTTSSGRPGLSQGTYNSLGYNAGSPGGHTDMVLDNPIWYDSLLTDEEFTADYDAQPWV